MTTIDQLTQLFDPISLEEMDKVSFLNRTDTKFIFHEDKLPLILERIKDDYRILTFGKESLIKYDTLYYDTPEKLMYYQHHKGKATRLKVRTRIYSNSGLHFFEIKFKDNKGRTIKKRITTPKQDIGPECDIFIEKLTDFHLSDLQPALRVVFNRNTLVHKSLSIRITLDTGLQYTEIENKKSFSLDHIAIMEIKQDRFTRSEIEKTLHELGINSDGFSKYCIGLCLLNDFIRKNNFKQNLLKIKKLQNET